MAFDSPLHGATSTRTQIAVSGGRLERAENTRRSASGQRPSVSHCGAVGDLILMAHQRGYLAFACVLAASLAGCMVRTQSRPAASHHVPPGQIRRAEVHERNAARKSAHDEGRGHGHHRGHGHGHD
jgi:hypothetical protein